MPPINNEKIRVRLNLAIEELRELDQLLTSTLRGLKVMANLQGTVKVLHLHDFDTLDEEERKDYEDTILLLQAEEVIYNKHKAEDFTKILEMYTVYLWSKIENLITDLLQEYVSSGISLTSLSNLPNITLPLTFIDLSDQEKSRYIVNQVSQKLNVPLKQGIGRFEALLKAFDMGGEVPKKIRDIIYELSNLRNIIVHNNSFVDERFLTNCPQVGYGLGQRIKINQDMFDTYITAVQAYILVVIVRFKNEELPSDFKSYWSI